MKKKKNPKILGGKKKRGWYPGIPWPPRGFFSTPPPIMHDNEFFSCLRPRIALFRLFLKVAYIICIPNVAYIFCRTVGLCSLGALKSYFSAPKRKNFGFFFSFFRRRLVMVFGGQITFSTPQKCFSAPNFFFRRFFFFGAPKNRRFRRPKPKIGFFGGRRRSKGLVCLEQTKMTINF